MNYGARATFLIKALCIRMLQKFVGKMGLKDKICVCVCVEMLKSMTSFFFFNKVCFVQTFGRYLSQWPTFT